MPSCETSGHFISAAHFLTCKKAIIAFSTSHGGCGGKCTEDALGKHVLWIKCCDKECIYSGDKNVFMEEETSAQGSALPSITASGRFRNGAQEYCISGPGPLERQQPEQHWLKIAVCSLKPFGIFCFLHYQSCFALSKYTRNLVPFRVAMSFPHLFEAASFTCCLTTELIHSLYSLGVGSVMDEGAQ